MQWLLRVMHVINNCNIKQVAQLWQRDRTSSIDDFQGWVNLRLDFRLMGYVLYH